MRSGKMNRPGELWSTTFTEADAGDATEVDTLVCPVWLCFLSATGREYSEAKQLNADVTHVIRMRDLPGVVIYPNRHWLKYDGRTFEIVAAVDEREAHRSVLLQCIEAVAEEV